MGMAANKSGVIDALCEVVTDYENPTGDLIVHDIAKDIIRFGGLRLILTSIVEPGNKWARYLELIRVVRRMVVMIVAYPEYYKSVTKQVDFDLVWGMLRVGDDPKKTTYKWLTGDPENEHLKAKSNVAVFISAMSDISRKFRTRVISSGMFNYLFNIATTTGMEGAIMALGDIGLHKDVANQIAAYVDKVLGLHEILLNEGGNWHVPQEPIVKLFAYLTTKPLVAAALLLEGELEHILPIIGKHKKNHQ
eukprot:TRINITY_DN20749_c0_g1_i1.p1 TRINITY_DN20749_c0_g1~~TRINITY_DN20749_c0_g1_i1.p1  ORF type:complete len:249 (+),score=9.56 TRINITY_DN20749_c0_g1_i1:1-747(+)